MQSKLTKFHHAYDAYWRKVEAALIQQYHCSGDQAFNWTADKQSALLEELGEEQIPDTILPERMAQEIFMEHAE